MKTKQEKKILITEILIVIALLIAVLLPNLIGAPETETKVTGMYGCVDDLNGADFVTVTGSAYGPTIEERFDKSELIYVNEWSDMALSVAQGKTDAFIAERSSLQEYKDSYPELVVMPDPVSTMDLNFGMQNTAMGDLLKRSFNEYLKTIRENGKYDELYAKWVTSEEKPDHIDIEPLGGESVDGEPIDTVKVVTILDWYPYCYLDEEEPCGFMLELVLDFCSWAGFEADVEIADVQGALAGFETGKYDIFAYGLAGSDEKSEIINFTDVMLSEYVHAMIHEDNYAYNTTAQTLDDINKEGSVIGINSSSSVNDSTWKILSNVTPQSYDSYDALYKDVSEGKIEGAMVTYDQAPYINSKYPDLAIIDEPVSIANSSDETEEGSDYASLPYIVVKQEVTAAGVQQTKAEQFISSLKKSFEKTFIREDRWKLLAKGLWVTIELAVLAGVFGTILGAVICALSMSKHTLPISIGRLYTKIAQGMPIVVLLLILYYIVFGHMDASAFWVCVLGFTLDFAAYTSEIFRNGIMAVPEGQYKAARALGFGKVKAFVKVVLPQAMQHILPVYSGQFISMVKQTSVAGYISVIDLTKASDIIRSRTYEAFFPLIVTAIIYFIIALLLVQVLKVIQKKTDPMLRSREVKGVKK